MRKKLLLTLRFRKQELEAKLKCTKEYEQNKKFLPPDLYTIAEIRGRINEISMLIDFLKLLKEFE